MNDINTLTPFEIRNIVERHWAGESLPTLADAFHINRVQLFNFKNENTRMWAGIEHNIVKSEIRSLIHADARAELSDRDAARVQLCFFLLRHLPSRGARALPYRDFIVENVLRFTHDDPDKQHLFERTEIDQLDDAKEAVATFETQLGITLLETPPHPHTGERTMYHVQ